MKKSLVVPVVLMLAAFAGADEPARVTFIHGGEPLPCRVEALSDAATLTVRAGEGTRQIALTDIQQIAFSATSTQPTGALAVELTGGSRLLGRIVGGDSAALRLSVGPLGEVALPLEKIRAAINGEVDGASGGAAAMADARAAGRTQDVLLLPMEGSIQPFPTLIRHLDEKGAHIQIEEDVREVAWSRIHAIVFAVLKGADAGPAPARAVLTDGSVVAGTITAFSAETLTLDTSFKAPLAIPVDRIARLEFTSEKVTFLSDLTPEKTEQAGYFGQSWPVRGDVNLAGGPLVLGGITHAKGIACHSHAAITYAIEGKYKTFAATIGIDDATGGVGNCLFRVTDGEGKVLFDSGDVAAGEKPRPISVDVTGAAKIILVVDFGKDEDVGDDAVWADARLIKP